ncbi:hypothetical protein V6N13_055083 [Hibiscus sabdariffa]
MGVKIMQTALRVHKGEVELDDFECVEVRLHVLVVDNRNGLSDEMFIEFNDAPGKFDICEDKRHLFPNAEKKALNTS